MKRPAGIKPRVVLLGLAAWLALAGLVFLGTGHGEAVVALLVILPIGLLAVLVGGGAAVFGAVAGPMIVFPICLPWVLLAIDAAFAGLSGPPKQPGRTSAWSRAIRRLREACEALAAGALLGGLYGAAVLTVVFGLILLLQGNLGSNPVAAIGLLGLAGAAVGGALGGTFGLVRSWSMDREERETTRADCLRPAIRALRPWCRWAVPAVGVTIAESGDDYLVRDAIEAAARIGPAAARAVPALIGRLSDPDPLVRYQAALALAAIGPTAHAPALADAMGRLDPLTRSELVASLGAVGAGIDADVPPLYRALSGRDEGEMARALDELGDRAVPDLIRAAGSVDASVSEKAVAALGKHGAGSEAAVGELVRRLRWPGRPDDEHMLRRLEAAMALAEMGPAARAAVPDLVRSLRDPHCRDWAAEALGAIGPDAAAAAPDLRRGLGGDDPHHRAIAAWALWRITREPGESLRALIPLLRPDGRGDRDTRWRAAKKLGAMGADAAEAVPDLARLLSQGRGDEAVAAAEALGAIGADAPESARAIEDLLRALPRIEPEMDPGISPFQDSRVRLAAAVAHRRITGRDDLAVPAMVELLREEGPFCDISDEGYHIGTSRPDFFRVRVVETLGSLGPGVTGAVRALEQALGDPSERVREAAAEALDASRP